MLKSARLCGCFPPKPQVSLSAHTKHRETLRLLVLFSPRNPRVSISAHLSGPVFKVFKVGLGGGFGGLAGPPDTKNPPPLSPPAGSAAACAVG